MKTDLTAEKLRSLLNYDLITGEFTWKKQKGQKNAGAPAGWHGRERYVQIGVDGHLYYAHRLVWLYVYGKWPLNQLDHINGNPSDNSLINLRECKIGRAHV